MAMGKGLWTFSNGLSLLRILLAIPIVLSLESSAPEARLIALGLILVAAATDLLDGWLARRLHQVSDMGKILDPLADKIIVAVVIVTLVLLDAVPVWFCILVILRDMIIFAGGIHIRISKGVLLQSNWTGKWAVSSVALYIFMVVADRKELLLVQNIMLIVSVIMLSLSFVFYLRRYLDALGSASAPSDVLPKNV